MTPNASLAGTTSCKVFSLHRNNFQFIGATVGTTALLERINFLRRVTLFSLLSDVMLQRVASAASSVAFSNGEHIFDQGDVGDQFYIIEEGSVRLTKSSTMSGQAAPASEPASRSESGQG